MSRKIQHRCDRASMKRAKQQPKDKNGSKFEARICSCGKRFYKKTQKINGTEYISWEEIK